MAELTLRQIEDKLNEEFKKEKRRKIIFWYDGKGEFVNEIDSLKLENAEILHLQEDEQFRTKIILEREKKTTNFLIYAPFPKPNIRDNHLADTLKYSQEFTADRISLLMSELKIDENYRNIMEKNHKFFAAKERINSFARLDISQYDEESIIVGIMSSICKTQTASFEEVLRALFFDEDLDKSNYFFEFQKYGLIEDFWRLCLEYFGIKDENINLRKLLNYIFVTSTKQSLSDFFPSEWEQLLASKTGNVIAFLENFRNNIQYRERCLELAEMVANNLSAESKFSSVLPEYFLNCDTFSFFDKYIIKWIIERLLDENLSAQLQGMDILTICDLRKKMYYGDVFAIHYQVLKYAYQVLQVIPYSCPNNIKDIIKQYVESDFLIDTYYRKFYYYYDQLKDKTDFEELRDLVENIYTYKYLDVIIPEWNKAIVAEEAFPIPLQSKFYNHYLENPKIKTVVIISDALRYELGKNLVKRLERNPKNISVSIEPLLGLLPSITKLGMAALLPHTSISITDDNRVLVDGKSVDDLKQREEILKTYAPDSCCIQFDELKMMKSDEIREKFSGKNLIYIYHNQIDARGDNARTENEVFQASKETMKEIEDLIVSLTGNLTITQYIIISDHGFLYKRDKLSESYKIYSTNNKNDFIGRRFNISKNQYEIKGILSLPLSRFVDDVEGRYVNFPTSSAVFKLPGGGQNYVHGGSSPQELLIPVIQVKTTKRRKQTEFAKIIPISKYQKITNLIMSFDFIQQEALSDTVIPADYQVFFESETGEKITNVALYRADKKDKEPEKRIFRLQFNFRNKKYDRSEKYYMVIRNENNGEELLRDQIFIDIAFSDNFGFNF